MNPVNDNAGVFSGLDANPCILTRLGDIIFAIPIACVEDVFATPAITPAPLAPDHVLGLLNLRGKVMSALCLAQRLGLPPATVPIADTLIIGVSHLGEAHGLLVPDVGEVIALPPALRQPVPSHFQAPWISCAAGLHKHDQGLIVELDIQSLLQFSTSTPHAA